MHIPPAIAAFAPDGKLTPAHRRRILIDICRRHIKPGTGSGYDFLQRRTAMNPWPDLRPILQGIPWAIVGGVATRAYMPERATQNLDILVHQRDGDDVIERLETAGYFCLSQLAVPGYVLRSPDRVEVDVIFGAYAWLDDALMHPRRDLAGYPVLDLPYLIVMKTEASRGRDVGDVTTMFSLASKEDLARVRTIVKRHAPHLVDDVESLIYLGQFEMKGGEGVA